MPSNLVFALAVQRPGRGSAVAGLTLAGVALALLALPRPVLATSEFFRALGIQAPQAMVEAPEFALPDLTGKIVRLKELRGRHVFLNFFATWCGPCREEMPAMERLHQTYGGKGLVILAVDLEESAARVGKFVKELRLTFPAVLDGDGAVSRAFAVRGLPITVLVDRDGRILWRAFGSREWNNQAARKYFAAILDDRGRKAEGRKQ